MKISLPILVLLVLLGTGCSSQITSEKMDDFIPIQGKATIPQGAEGQPQEKRLMTAISYDGITYTQNNTWVCDQCHAPDAVIQDGTIYLYYTGWMVGDRLNSTAVATSTDDGASWNYRYLELQGGEDVYRVVNPDVVLLDDGTFRLFFTAGNPQGIHYAEGTDGINFTYKGVVFAQTDDVAIDSTTMKINDTWHMYALSEEGVNRLWHLTSTDGVSFSVYDLTSFPNAGVVSMPSTGLWLDDRYYLFLFSPEGSIGSMWTKNGFDWYPSETTHLSPVDTETFVGDSTVVPLDNGRSLMIYVTNIP